MLSLSTGVTSFSFDVSFYGAFQKEVLAKIKQFPHKKQKTHYQYLSDRISCAETGKQKYGTQDICEKN